MVLCVINQKIQGIKNLIILALILGEAMANEDANQTFEFEVEDKQEQRESKNKESPSAADILKRIRECYGESVAKAFEGEKF